MDAKYEALFTPWKIGNVVVTVIVSALLIIGSGVAGFFVTKAIIAKKNAQPEAEEIETEPEAESEQVEE